eukprot:3197803-Prymnesium_polylepis.2
MAVPRSAGSDRRGGVWRGSTAVCRVPPSQRNAAAGGGGLTLFVELAKLGDGEATREVEDGEDAHEAALGSRRRLAVELEVLVLQQPQIALRRPRRGRAQLHHARATCFGATRDGPAADENTSRAWHSPRLSTRAPHRSNMQRAHLEPLILAELLEPTVDVRLTEREVLDHEAAA